MVRGYGTCAPLDTPLAAYNGNCIRGSTWLNCKTLCIVNKYFSLSLFVCIFRPNNKLYKNKHYTRKNVFSYFSVHLNTTYKCLLNVIIRILVLI